MCISFLSSVHARRIPCVPTYPQTHTHTHTKWIQAKEMAWSSPDEGGRGCKIVRFENSVLRFSR